MIRISVSGANEAAAALTDVHGKIPRAVGSAIRRTLRGGRKDAGTKIKERYTINAGHVTRTIRTQVAGFSGSMKSSGGRNPLSRFHLRPKSRPRIMPAGGVFVQNVRGQGGNLAHAFLQRNGEPYEREGRSRYPIKRITGPSAPGMMSSPPVSSYLLDKMQRRLQINLEHELRYFL